MSSKISIDAEECISKGLVGFLGAVPATICAHPCDAIKIRMQVSGQRLSSVLKNIHTSSTSTLTTAAATKKAFPVISNLYRGLGAGIQQKMFTRGPMFFFSDLATQICEKKAGFDRTIATFVGSTCSGYCTGFIAAPREWMKVLSNTTSVSVPASMASSIPIQQYQGSSLILAAYRSNNLPSVVRRMHGAGVRNAIFDSIFFGSQHIALERFKGYLSPGCSYAVAAVMALTLDYVVDVTVKRAMSIPPQSPAYTSGSVLKSTWQLLIQNGIVPSYRGLSVKAVEFLLSYFITGACSIYIIKMCTEIANNPS